MKTMSVKIKTLKEVNSILRSTLNGDPLALSNAGHLHGLAAGLKHGEVIIKGDAGDYLAVVNDGATVHVSQNAGNYAADNMTAGTVIIDGNGNVARLFIGGGPKYIEQVSEALEAAVKAPAGQGPSP